MISPLAYIHPEAKIGENVEIAPFVFTFVVITPPETRRSAGAEPSVSRALRISTEVFMNNQCWVCGVRW